MTDCQDKAGAYVAKYQYLTVLTVRDGQDQENITQRCPFIYTGQA